MRQGFILSDYSDKSQDMHFEADNLRPTLEIDFSAELSSISLFDKQGEKRSDFMIQSNGSPLLALWSAGQKQCSGDIITDDHISLFDKDQTIRTTLGAAQLENTRTGSTEDTGPSSLTFFDQKGKLIWQAPR